MDRLQNLSKRNINPVTKRELLSFINGPQREAVLAFKTFVGAVGRLRNQHPIQVGRISVVG
jgi:hypothetical protein